MDTVILAFVILCLAFVVEEFILIKPVSTIAGSDPLSRRLEIAAIWLPAIGMALSGSTVRSYASVWLGGAVNALGVVLCVAGLALRYWSRRVLGRFFTIGVVRQQGHQVIRSGPYRWVRHPGYLAFLLFYTGLPMVLGSWFGLVVLSLPAIVVFVALVIVEDRRLEEELGSEYAAYKSESHRLVPGLW